MHGIFPRFQGCGCKGLPDVVLLSEKAAMQNLKVLAKVILSDKTVNIWPRRRVRHVHRGGRGSRGIESPFLQTLK